jgi:cystathionine beta-synthase
MQRSLPVCNNVLEMVGRTPLIRLNRVTENIQCQFWAKVEYFNPGLSVKDRIAVAMVEEAEKQGLLKPGATIIEATSGNTGVGLAMVAAVKGYRCIFVMPDKMSDEKVRLLKAYGAEVVIVPTDVPPDSPDSYTGVSARLLNEIPGAWRPDQHANMTNPEIHYRTTGPEIWEQTQGKITHFVGGVGTGGSMSGIGKFLKEKNPKIRIVGADPEGSILSGGALGSWAVEGIGEDTVPRTFNIQIVDDWVRVSDAESFMTARRIAREEGMLLGGSCGTVLAAALRYAQRLGPDDVLVALSPDSGRNYITKMYNDEWMEQKGYLQPLTKSMTAGEVLARQGKRTIFSLTPEDSVEKAIQILRQQSISQLPVLDHDRVVGSVQEITVARFLHAHRDPRTTPVRDVMARPLPHVEEHVTVDEVYSILLSGATGCLVMKKGKLAGIITRIDLVECWDRQPVEA